MKPRESMCAAVRAQLPSTGASAELPNPLASHAAECLRCQAEVTRSRRIRRSLAELADVRVPAPAGFAAAVEGAIDLPVTPEGHRIRQGTTVAAAAGALAAAAGTLVVIGWMRARSAA
jgi:hypothetical protein